MKKSSFWLQVGILCLGFVLLNLLAKRFVVGSLPHVVLQRIHSEPNPTHIFIGNSVVMAGARPEVVKAHLPTSRPLNIAMGGCPAPEFFLVFNEVKTSPADKPRVYIGFFDRTLTDNLSVDWSLLSGNRSVCYMTDMNEAIRLMAPDKPILQLQMRLTRFFPLLIERSTLWKRVELMKRSVGEIGMPKVKTNEFGRVDDFAALEEKDPLAFAAKCEEVVRDNRPFNPGITSIVEQTKKRGGELYFIEMPVPSWHRHKYYASPQWSAYAGHLKTLAAQAGAKYVDCSRWMPDNLFIDHVHLSRKGGSIFTTKLLPYMK